MKKALILGVIIMTLTSSSCPRKYTGELTGADTVEWEPGAPPIGMSLIPAGSFTMGSAEYDVAATMISPSKTVSVASFYIDETEITNNQYRQFVHWVRDSIIRVQLAELAESSASGDGLEQYKYIISSKGDTLLPKLDNKLSFKNLSMDIDTASYDELVDYMYLPKEETTKGAMLRSEKLVYKYAWLDIKKAIKERGRRKDYIRHESIAVYPDTTVWVRDFTYSFNEPMHEQYFWHAAYNDYPVVGVTFDQAKAFCNWRTKSRNDYLRSQGEPTVSAFRLPTEAEWEYSARGGLAYGTYPWGGPYPDDDRGCFMANFKPMRGDYLADHALYTAQADAYDVNGYGLYNMAGNVAEWTNTAYDVSSYYFVSTMNPNYEDENNSRKVIRGGSWKDVAYYLQVSSRDYEYKDSARSYIGFRTVQSYQGTNLN